MQNKLSRESKESIGLLSIGTFLEYFDLMLYVHMANLLNELFFPQTDQRTASLLASFAFCSTFVFRPLGALIFGYVGDNLGRKFTVIVTTMLMGFSCVTMALLPTYAQIGITAAWIVTICRALQGFASMGEIVAAELYVTESLKAPLSYSAVTIIGACASLGSVVAILVAYLVTSNDAISWRIAFCLGAVIAIVGSVARTRLRETLDFVDMKRRMSKAIAASQKNGLSKPAELLKSLNPIFSEKVNKYAVLSLFTMDCLWPVCFYLAYIHCSSILRNNFGYNPAEIIAHNFFVTLVQLSNTLILAYVSYYIYPLKILRIIGTISFIFFMISPYLIGHVSSPMHVFLLQISFITLRPDVAPALPIFYINLPIFKRFTYISLMFAISRAFIYVLTSFGFIYLIEYFGNYGMLIILMPVITGFMISLAYFTKLAQATKFRPI